MYVRTLSRAEVREVDRKAIEEYGMSGLVLMENAGRGCVDVMCEVGCNGPVVVVCGKGNNAGDGFVIARQLMVRGIPATVVLLHAPGELRGDAAANLGILKHCGVPIFDLPGGFDVVAFQSALAEAEWIVDAILGTGATGAPRQPADAAIRVMNAATAKRLAVDLPSGLDCDTGEAAEPTFVADHTCTFVAAKVGFGNPAAARFLGEVHVLDIGVPWDIVNQ